MNNLRKISAVFACVASIIFSSSAYAGIACISFGGNVSLSNLTIDIAGVIPCTEYDRLIVSGDLFLSGGDLNLILQNDFVPSIGNTFQIFVTSNIIGTFGTIDTTAAALPTGLEWDFSELYATGELNVISLSAVPIPAAVWLFGSGLLGLVSMARLKENRGQNTVFAKKKTGVRTQFSLILESIEFRPQLFENVLSSDPNYLTPIIFVEK